MKETYTLFLYRCLSLLQNEGKLCFIIPDTCL
ncbi:Eco57I restriction-modification methylase domain-containing protein [Eggerthellaceae bacterium PR-HUZ602407-17]